MKLNWPDDSHRLALYGQTGSGKTLWGLWHLEKRSWLKRPWTIFDYKHDPHIRLISRLEEIDIRHAPPKHPGLYVTRPFLHQREDVERYLWRVWEQEDHGIFADELYRISSLRRPSDAFDALMTQGRTKNIPIVGLSQRPAWLSPFYMTELDFHVVMHLKKPQDLDKLKDYGLDMPYGTQRNFHSIYYDVAEDRQHYLAPVPNRAEILNRYDLKMPRRMRHGDILRNAPKRGSVREITHRR